MREATFGEELDVTILTFNIASDSGLSPKIPLPLHDERDDHFPPEELLPIPGSLSSSRIGDCRQGQQNEGQRNDALNFATSLPSFFVRARVGVDPIRLPGLAAVGGEGLFGAHFVRRDGPDGETNQDVAAVV